MRRCIECFGRPLAPEPAPVARVQQNSASTMMRITTRSLLALGTSLALFPCASNADQVNDARLEEIVVVESRLARDAVTAGDQISVIQQDLRKSVPVDSEQLFRGLPGFSVSRPGGAGGVSEVFLRGAESNFTAVIVDGMRLNNPANTRGGSYDFSSLAIQDVDRVDIATGAMSAIYGSDAMAGVIRIASAWANPGTFSWFGEAGSDQQWRVGLGTSTKLGSASTVSFSASGTDGGDELPGSTFRLTSLATRVEHDGTGDSRWRLNLRYSERDRSSFPEVSGGPLLAVSSELEMSEADETGVSLSGDFLLEGGWESELTASWVRIREDATTPAVPPGVLDGQPAFSSSASYERSQALWLARHTGLPRLSVVFGADVIHETGSDDGEVDFDFGSVPNSYEIDRTTFSVFAEFGTELPAGTNLNLALRGDNADGENRGSFKLSVVKTLGPLGEVWVRIASGFKLPSLFALGNSLFGNPDLLPETVSSIEAGYRGRISEHTEFDASLFSSRYEDLIDFDFESFRNINRGRTDIRGATLRWSTTLSDSTRLVGDLMLSDIDAGDDPLRRRPEQTGGIALEWDVDVSWSLNLKARYVGPRLITSIPTGDIEDDGYWLLDAVVSHPIGAGQTLWFGIDNITDTEYQDAPGFPAPGTRVRIGLRGEF